MRVGIDDCIEIRTELRGVDPRGVSCSIHDSCARNEAAALNRSQLPDRRAVAADDYRSSGLYLAQHRTGLIAELSLSNGTDFHDSA
jgi:hypothetical protein